MFWTKKIYHRSFYLGVMHGLAYTQHTHVAPDKNGGRNIARWSLNQPTGTRIFKKKHTERESYADWSCRTITKRVISWGMCVINLIVVREWCYILMSMSLYQSLSGWTYVCVCNLAIVNYTFGLELLWATGRLRLFGRPGGSLFSHIALGWCFGRVFLSNYCKLLTINVMLAMTC